MKRRNFLAAIPVISALVAAGSLVALGDPVQPVDDGLGDPVQPVDDGLDDFIPGYIKDTYSPVELEAYKKELSAALKSNCPLTTWTCKSEEIDEWSSYESIYGSYPAGWSKPIGVSYRDWELGTLVRINSTTYTVIEVIGPEFGDPGQQSLLLDRPLEEDIEAYSGRQSSCIKIVGSSKLNLLPYQRTFVSRALWH